MNTQNFSYDFLLQFDNHWYIQYNEGGQRNLRLRVSINYLIKHKDIWIKNSIEYHHYISMLQWLEENYPEVLI